MEGAQSLSDHYLVELSAVTLSGHDNVGMEMRQFAEQLKPYPLYIITDIYLQLINIKREDPLKAYNLIVDCPMLKLKCAFNSSLKGLSNYVFRFGIL